MVCESIKGLVRRTLAGQTSNSTKRWQGHIFKPLAGSRILTNNTGRILEIGYKEPIAKELANAKQKMDENEYLAAIRSLQRVKELDPQNAQAATTMSAAIARSPSKPGKNDLIRTDGRFRASTGASASSGATTAGFTTAAIPAWDA